jgi:hypothetical protein
MSNGAIVHFLQINSRRHTVLWNCIDKTSAYETVKTSEELH